MEITLSTRQAYSEIVEFLSLLDEQTVNEIPLQLRNFFSKNQDQSYHKQIQLDLPIEEQDLKSETLAIIALLNLQYWCQDEDEKEKLREIYAYNENLYQQDLHEKYNPANMFKDFNQELEENPAEEQVAMVEYKEPVLKRIFQKIKNFFRIG